MNDNDPLGLKELEAKLGNINFGLPKAKPVYSKDLPKPRKLVDRKDIEDMRKTVQEGIKIYKETSRAILKILGRNKIPENYDEVMALVDKLENEEVREKTKVEAQEKIKKLLQRKKDREQIKKELKG